MVWLFEGLDVPSEPDTRQRVDTALREHLKTPEGAHCPEIWTAIKELSDEERSALVPCVRDLLKL
jgi:hypothetical protein